VLLIRLRSIGDTVLMTPCLSTLKAWSPDLKIAVVSEPLAAPLLEDHPLVDELIVTQSTIVSRSSLVARLRRGRFDVAFNMHGGPTAAILARLSGAPRTVGYQDLPLSWLLSDRAPSPDAILGRSRIHSVEQQLALLSWAGVELGASRAKLSLTVGFDAEARVRERLEALGLAGLNRNVSAAFASIVPGAAFESKRWNAEGFAAVADHLSERWNLPSVIVAGPGQEKLARQVACAARVDSAVLTGVSLKELVAVLRMSRVFVGNDSGPMHIAAALDRPIVAVWGSSDSTVWHPWTEAPHRVVGGRGKNDGETGRRGDGAKLERDASSIRQVRASEVTAAVDEVLELALEANSTVGQSQARGAKLDAEATRS
jgi:ADP-heptose:LPS heptosyltransferase